MSALNTPHLSILKWAEGNKQLTENKKQLAECYKQRAKSKKQSATRKKFHLTSKALLRNLSKRKIFEFKKNDIYGELLNYLQDFSQDRK